MDPKSKGIKVMKLQLEIRANEGYSADQVKAITVSDLKEMLAWYDDEDTIVLYDQNNRRGACYGVIWDIEELDEDEDLEAEEEDDGDDLIADIMDDENEKEIA